MTTEQIHSLNELVNCQADDEILIYHNYDFWYKKKPFVICHINKYHYLAIFVPLSQYKGNQTPITQFVI